MSVFEIVYPGSLNWFYRHQADAFANDLSLAGYKTMATSAELFAEAPNKGNTVLILSLWESIFAAEKQGQGEILIKKLKTYRNRVLLNYDSLFTQYFRRHFVHDEDLITHIIDIGHFKQADSDHIYFRPYTWMPESFTSSELESLGGGEFIPSDRVLDENSKARPLAWASMGHANISRSALILGCIEVFGPNGFVFMPPVRPFDQSNGLEVDAIAKVLEKCEVYVWGSHHPHPYHEGLRAQHAIISGAVPLKVDPRNAHHFEDLPWVYSNLSLYTEDLKKYGREFLFDRCRRFAVGRGTAGSLLANSLNNLGLK